MIPDETFFRGSRTSTGSGRASYAPATALCAMKAATSCVASAGVPDGLRCSRILFHHPPKERTMSRAAAKCFVILIPLILATSVQPAAQSRKAPVRVSDSIAFSFINDCTGESVSAVVNRKVTNQFFADASGGLHTHLHQVLSGRAVGESSGIQVHSSTDRPQQLFVEQQWPHGRDLYAQPQIYQPRRHR